MEHLSDTSFLGKLLVFLTNASLDWKVIASYKHSSLFCLVISDEGKNYNIDTRKKDSPPSRSKAMKTALMKMAASKKYLGPTV